MSKNLYEDLRKLEKDLIEVGFESDTLCNVLSWLNAIKLSVYIKEKEDQSE